MKTGFCRSNISSDKH